MALRYTASILFRAAQDDAAVMTIKQGYGFRLVLLGIFLATWAWAAWKPLHPDDWLLENYMVFFWVPVLVITARFFRLSQISYGLITLFMCLHVIGSHYTYAEVPFGDVLQVWWGGERNMYDRLVHFCFGLLLAYPVREVLVRIAQLRGFWAYFFPIDITFSISAIYEIIEWKAATLVAPELGLAFLGTQGDVWDAQKDMLLAGIGAIIAMMIVLVINLWLNSNASTEIRDSLRVRQDDHPLGEESLEKWLEKERQ